MFDPIETPPFLLNLHSGEERGLVSFIFFSFFLSLNSQSSPCFVFVFMENMSKARVSSSPELLCQSSTFVPEPFNDSALEGVAANIKLLLKLVEDHKDACSKAKKDSRRMLRVAGMMTILDLVRTRIQKCQSFGSRRSEAELRRCDTDLRGQQPAAVARDKRPTEPPVDEKEKLRRELSSCLSARKSMEVMCSSLGKEKEIMAIELARKVQQLNGMEEHINDLKAQNRTLLEKVQEFHAENKGNDGSGSTVGADHGEERETNEANAALEAHNKMLSAQLVSSIDGYKMMKSKLNEVQEENSALRFAMEEMEGKVKCSLERIHSLKMLVGEEAEFTVAVKEEIEELDHCFKWFERKISTHIVKASECTKKPSADNNGDKEYSTL